MDGRITTGPAAWADPARVEAVFANLRRDQPVSLVDVPDYPPFWLVTRHADVRAVERDAAGFTNHPRLVLQTAELDARLNSSGKPRTLARMDGPEHRAHRDVTADWFRPRSLRGDETVLPDADRFDITRGRNRRVAFGFGVHTCLGANLARIKPRLLFTELASAAASGARRRTGLGPVPDRRRGPAPTDPLPGGRTRPSRTGASVTTQAGHVPVHSGRASRRTRGALPSRPGSGPRRR